jgi:hypothetical protein
VGDVQRRHLVVPTSAEREERAARQRGPHRRFKAWHESGVLKRVMDQLFGEASAELCGMMEARMRIHVSPEEKAARTAAVPVAPSKPAVYGPASSQPPVPSVFSLAGSYKHAA